MKFRFLKTVLMLLAQVVSFGQPAMFREHTSNGYRHSVWVPAGYQEVWWPESRGAKLRQESKAIFAAMRMPTSKFMAVLVKTKDLDNYEKGGNSPMKGHYIYISWFPAQKMPSNKELMNQFNGAVSNAGSLLQALKNDKDAGQFFRDHFPAGSMVPLGVLRNWKDGYIFSLAIGLEMTYQGHNGNTAKILSMAYQQGANGYWVVNYVTLQDYGAKFQASLDQATLVAKLLRSEPNKP